MSTFSSELDEWIKKKEDSLDKLDEWIERKEDDLYGYGWGFFVAGLMGSSLPIVGCLWFFTDKFWGGFILLGVITLGCWTLAGYGVHLIILVSKWRRERKAEKKKKLNHG